MKYITIAALVGTAVLFVGAASAQQGVDFSKCPSEDFLSPLNHLDSMEPILIRGRGFHCGRIRTGRGMTAIT